MVPNITDDKSYDVKYNLNQSSVQANEFRVSQSYDGSIGDSVNGYYLRIDVDAIAPGFQLLAGMLGPSHAWVAVTGFGEPVNVAGMAVASGDLIHADRHGAVVIPHDVARDIPAAAALVARRETVILEAAGKPGFNAQRLAAAMDESGEIH